MKANLERITIWLDVKTITALKVKAAKEERSLGWIIRKELEKVK
ncbi:MAG TPA: ribbon-helix-helix protein, CopG family [Candidatus Acidoferrum sp.]